MNVSIITMTRTYNYGATLQAYALQTYIESLGHNCNIIDHMAFSDSHRTVPINDFSINNLLKFPVKRQIERGYYNFEQFYKEYMKMTKRYETIDELISNPPNSDVFITGSDQVWNPRDSKINKFFLEFVPEHKLRISYAASIGDSIIPDEQKDYYRQKLKLFNGISVREEEGKSILNELTDKDISVNCDPIFLIEKGKWSSLEKTVECIKKPYILCYMIYRPEWYNKFIKEIKKRTGYEIVLMDLNGISRLNADRYIRFAGPKEYLWLIDNAEIVVSSSFHGNAFSILFGKKLISIPDPKRPDRIHNLLQMFDMNDCSISDNDPNIIQNIQKDSNENIRKIISIQQNKTYKYFSEIGLG